MWIYSYGMRRCNSEPVPNRETTFFAKKMDDCNADRFSLADSAFSRHSSWEF